MNQQNDLVVDAIDDEGLDAAIDRVALAQAQHDFEVANARVRDLTSRLTEVTATVATLRAELADAARAHQELLERHEQMRQSRAFRTATLIWNLRNALRS